MEKQAGSRVEFLFYTIYCAFLSIFWRTYWPTNANMALVHRDFFIFLFVICGCVVLAPGVSVAWRGLHRVVKIFLLLVLFAPGTLLLLRMTLFSMGLLGILSLAALAGLALLEVGILVFMVWRASARRGKHFKPLRFYVFSALFVNVAILIPISMMLWRPPTKNERGVRQAPGGAVSRLTGPEMRRELSTPYDLLYLADKKILVASFKMAGNQMLSFWDRPRANKFLAIRIDDPEKPETVTLPMTGTLMPECMARRPGTNSVFITRVGFGRHDITQVDISDYPDVKIIGNNYIDFEPNGLAFTPDGAALMVVGIEAAAAVFDPDTMKETRERLKVDLTARINAIDSYQAPGAGVVYLAMVGRKVTEIDMKTGRMRYARVRFGGGQLAADPAVGKLYQTDILFNALNVIDMSTMKLEKSVSLGYKPRAIQADPARDLLMIGDWFGGKVVIYRMSTLERLRPPVPVGRYIRNFAYDQERQLLFCACLCGVYAIDIGKILSDATATQSK